MSTSFDDAVRDIISKGGAPAQSGTPDQLTQQVNQSAAAPAAPAQAPAGAPQQEPAQNVAIDQNAVQPNSGDDDADELARINAGARTEQAQADAATAGQPDATAEPAAGDTGTETGSGTDQTAGEQAGGDPAASDSSDAGSQGSADDGAAQAEGTPGADPGLGAGGDEGDGGKDNAGTDGFDVDADDDGVDTDPDEESDLDQEPPQDDLDEGDSQEPEDDDEDQSPENDQGTGEGEGGETGESQTGEQADTGTGGQEGTADSGEVNDNFQDPGNEPAPENVEDADPENAADDSETTAAEQEQAEAAEQSENPAEKAAAVIREAREMSDRLGELAEQIVDRHVNTGEGQAPGATIPAGEEPATQEDLQTSIAAESHRAHQFTHRLLMQEARTRLGFAVESEASGTVYHQANVRMLEGAIGSLENLARGNISSKLHLDTKIEAIEERVNALAEVQTVTIDSRVISDLHVQGSLSLDTLIYAPVYQRAVSELREWLGTILGAYLKSAETGARAIVMPFTSGVLVDNAKIAQVLRETLPVCSDSVSRVLPGNRVMAYVKQDDAQKVLKVVRLTGQEPPAQITLTGTSIGSVKQAVNELKLLARAQQDSVRNIVALTNASKSILGWVNQANDDDLIRLDLPALLPMAYTPAISLHTAINAYIWALVGLLEAIVAKAKGTEGGA